MSERGYSYWVSDEQLLTFARQSPARRLQWLEELREVTFKLAPPQVREQWKALRGRRSAAVVLAPEDGSMTQARLVAAVRDGLDDLEAGRVVNNEDLDARFSAATKPTTEK